MKYTDNKMDLTACIKSTVAFRKRQRHWQDIKYVVKIPLKSVEVFMKY